MKRGASLALAPFSELGELALELRYAPSEIKSSLETKLQQYKLQVARLLEQSRSSAGEAVSYGLEYTVGVPEDFIADLKRLPISDIRAQYSFVEVDGEIFEFLDEAVMALEGIKMLGLQLDLSTWYARIERMRREWIEIAPKVVDSFRDRLSTKWAGFMKSTPPEFWWHHILVEQLER